MCLFNNGGGGGNVDKGPPPPVPPPPALKQPAPDLVLDPGPGPVTTTNPSSGGGSDTSGSSGSARRNDPNSANDQTKRVAGQVGRQRFSGPSAGTKKYRTGSLAIGAGKNSLRSGGLSI